MRFVPYEKLSKKKKRELDRAKRGDWGGISPVTRRAPDTKKYDRKKLRLPEDGEERLFSAPEGEAGGAGDRRARRVTKQSPFNGTVLYVIIKPQK